MRLVHVGVLLVLQFVVSAQTSSLVISDDINASYETWQTGCPLNNGRVCSFEPNLYPMACFPDRTGEHSCDCSGGDQSNVAVWTGYGCTTPLCFTSSIQKQYSCSFVFEPVVDDPVWGPLTGDVLGFTDGVSFPEYTDNVPQKLADATSLITHWIYPSTNNASAVHVTFDYFEMSCDLAPRLSVWSIDASGADVEDLLAGTSLSEGCGASSWFEFKLAAAPGLGVRLTLTGNPGSARTYSAYMASVPAIYDLHPQSAYFRDTIVIEAFTYLSRKDGATAPSASCVFLAKDETGLQLVEQKVAASLVSHGVYTCEVPDLEAGTGRRVDPSVSVQLMYEGHEDRFTVNDENHIGSFQYQDDPGDCSLVGGIGSDIYAYKVKKEYNAPPSNPMAFWNDTRMDVMDCVWDIEFSSYSDVAPHQDNAHDLMLQFHAIDLHSTSLLVQKKSFEESPAFDSFDYTETDWTDVALLGSDGSIDSVECYGMLQCASVTVGAASKLRLTLIGDRVEAEREGQSLDNFDPSRGFKLSYTSRPHSVQLVHNRVRASEDHLVSISGINIARTSASTGLFCRYSPSPSSYPPELGLVGVAVVTISQRLFGVQTVSCQFPALTEEVLSDAVSTSVELSVDGGVTFLPVGDILLYQELCEEDAQVFDGHGLLTDKLPAASLITERCRWTLNLQSQIHLYLSFPRQSTPCSGLSLSVESGRTRTRFCSEDFPSLPHCIEGTSPTGGDVWLCGISAGSRGQSVSEMVPVKIDYASDKSFGNGVRFELEYFSIPTVTSVGGTVSDDVAHITLLGTGFGPASLCVLGGDGERYDVATRFVDANEIVCTISGAELPFETSITVTTDLTHFSIRDQFNSEFTKTNAGIASAIQSEADANSTTSPPPSHPSTVLSFPHDEPRVLVSIDEMGLVTTFDEFVIKPEYIAAGSFGVALLCLAIGVPTYSRWHKKRSRERATTIAHHLHEDKMPPLDVVIAFFNEFDRGLATDLGVRLQKAELFPSRRIKASLSDVVGGEHGVAGGNAGGKYLSLSERREQRAVDLKRTIVFCPLITTPGMDVAKSISSTKPHPFLTDLDVSLDLLANGDVAVLPIRVDTAVKIGDRTVTAQLDLDPSSFPSRKPFGCTRTVRQMMNIVADLPYVSVKGSFALAPSTRDKLVRMIRTSFKKRLSKEMFHYMSDLDNAGRPHRTKHSALDVVEEFSRPSDEPVVRRRTVLRHARLLGLKLEMWRPEYGEKSFMHVNGWGDALFHTIVSSLIPELRAVGESVQHRFATSDVEEANEEEGQSMISDSGVCPFKDYGCEYSTKSTMAMKHHIETEASAHVRLLSERVK